MTADPDDLGLLDAFVAGDPTAFSALVERHEGMVFAVCLRILGDRELALDATQETFLTFFRKARTFRRQAKLTTWLYRIAVNAALDGGRSRSRQRAVALPDDHDPADPTAEDAFAAVELRPSLESALAAIPAEFRAAVVLTDAFGLGTAEVSGILGVPPGTVKSRVFRGRRLLAERLGNREVPEPRPMDTER